MFQTKLACRDCRTLNDEDNPHCSACGSSSLTEDWQGYVVISEPDGSEAAEMLGVSSKGTYALKV